MRLQSLRVLACVAFALMASEHVMSQESRTPSTAEIVDRLAPPGMRTRSLRNLQPVERRIDLNVQFEFDSAVILPAAEATLEQLGLALNSPRLSGARFRIEGHTDAAGSAEYNLLLSRRRAAAVVGYLAARGVTESRLDAVGKGFSELANPLDPLAPENRRVRVYAMD